MNNTLPKNMTWEQAVECALKTTKKWAEDFFPANDESKNFTLDNWSKHFTLKTKESHEQFIEPFFDVLTNDDVIDEETHVHIRFANEPYKAKSLQELAVLVAIDQLQKTIRKKWMAANGMEMVNYDDHSDSYPTDCLYVVNALENNITKSVYLTKNPYKALLTAREFYYEYSGKYNKDGQIIVHYHKDSKSNSPENVMFGGREEAKFLMRIDFEDTPIAVEEQLQKTYQKNKGILF